MAQHGELEYAVHRLGQDIIDFRRVDSRPLQEAVDSHLQTYRPKTSGGKEWQKSRIFCQAYTGAFIHMICTEVIVTESANDGDQQEVSGIGALQKFSEDATRPYSTAADSVRKLSLDAEHPLYEAGKSLLAIDLAGAEVEANAAFDPFREGGKLWSFSNEPEIALTTDYLDGGLIGNTVRNGKDIILTRALAHTIANGGKTPTSEQLTQLTGVELNQLVGLSSLVGPAFNQLLLGRHALHGLQAKLRQIAVEPKGPTPQFRESRWGKALEDFVDVHDPVVFQECATDAPLLQPVLFLPEIRKYGRCVGSIAWRPRLAFEWMLAHQYFEVDHGVPLDLHGRYSAAKFLLTNSLDVAGKTILNNEDFRVALETAAKYVLGK